LIVSQTQGAYTTIAGNAQFVMPASVYQAAQVVEVIGVTGDGYAVHVLPDGTLANQQRPCAPFPVRMFIH
jgi:hypothetical protein